MSRVMNAQAAALNASSPLPSPADWRDRRVTVLGLGIHGGGVAAARWLALQGARVTISDRADADTLRDSLEQLSGVPIAAIHVGGHRDEDLRSAQFLIVNPAIPSQHPALQVARDAGTVLTSEIELFLQYCPAPVIGVTGSNGKTTTCTMLWSVLQAAGRRVWLGGNIGRSLLGDLPQITRDDWVVLELSSFQLTHLRDTARWPRIAVVTNCVPNHLDWHGQLEAYQGAKRRLIEHLPRHGTGVLNPQDAATANWRDLDTEHCRYAWPDAEIPALIVPGNHNRENAACAAAAATAADVSRETIVQALQAFRGVEHRIEWIAEISGRRFYNDSKSTSPHATIAALRALRGRVWLLAGGHGKGADFNLLAGEITQAARGAALFGTARGALATAIQSRHAEFPLHVTEQLTDALAWCWQQSQAGDTILLSPACASYDQYRDFEARGTAFRRAVLALDAP